MLQFRHNQINGPLFYSFTLFTLLLAPQQIFATSSDENTPGLTLWNSFLKEPVDLSAAKDLVAKDKNLVNYIPPDRFGDSLLHICCLSGNFPAVKFLLSYQSIKVNQENQYGRTPLLHILNEENVFLDVLQELIYHPGLEINATNSHQVTALDVACSNKDFDTVQHLIQAGAYIVGIGGKSYIEESGLWILATKVQEKLVVSGYVREENNSNNPLVKSPTPQEIIVLIADFLFSDSPRKSVVI